MGHTYWPASGSAAAAGRLDAVQNGPCPSGPSGPTECDAAWAHAPQQYGGVTPMPSSSRRAGCGHPALAHLRFGPGTIFHPRRIVENPTITVATFRGSDDARPTRRRCAATSCANLTTSTSPTTTSRLRRRNSCSMATPHASRVASASVSVRRIPTEPSSNPHVDDRSPTVPRSPAYRTCSSTLAKPAGRIAVHLDVTRAPDIVASFACASV